jgi:WD40 repeat protein
VFRPDGVTLATARNDNAIGLGIPHSGEMFVTRCGHNNTVNDVAFSTTHALLASATHDGTAGFWCRPVWGKVFKKIRARARHVLALA